MNIMRTASLMILLTVLLVIVGYLLGGGNPATALVALVFALTLNFFGYWFSDKLALAMARAKPVSQEQEPELHRLVEDQATLAHMPKPRVYVIESDSPNAFATGRSPKHAVVAFTRGIVRLLNREELSGVVAHELAHIQNRDVLIMTIAAAIAGAITWLATMARWTMLFGGLGGNNRRNREGGGGYGGALGLVGLLIIIILMPLAALLIRLAISRSREYQADQTGAMVSGRPQVLASALEKLEAGSRTRPLQVNEAVSHLFIVNPLRADAIAHLFSTHPPIAERVRRLRQMRNRW